MYMRMYINKYPVYSCNIAVTLFHSWGYSCTVRLDLE